MQYIKENGIHLHLVNGSLSDVMGGYNTALQGKGWAVTVASSSGGCGGGGPTHTGTNGAAYGVFTGGGYGNMTDVDACAWPFKPSNDFGNLLLWRSRVRHAPRIAFTVIFSSGEPRDYGAFDKEGH